MSAATKTVPLPRRPYFLRAMHAWIGDSGLTPQIIVNTQVAGVRVPANYSDDAGRIVLNIGAEAVHNLELTNETVSFEARFGGVAHAIVVPVVAILGIYARESGEGIAFDNEEGAVATTDAPVAGQAPAADKSKPTLKIVK